MKNRFWKMIWATRFYLFQRHRYRRLVIEHIDGLSFVILPDVFNPTLFLSSVFFVRQFAKMISAAATVLDMGTGSGIGAVFAAKNAQHVTAIDINPEAVRSTQINVLLNRLEDRINVYQGDLFEPVRGEKFDVVLFNPPYFRGTPQDNHEYAWRANDVVERFAADLPDYLNPEGFGLMVVSTNGDLAGFLDAFHVNELKITAVAERNFGSEQIQVLKLEPQRHKVHESDSI